jgi:hypothetical protein
MTVYQFICKNHEPPIVIDAPGALPCPACGVVMGKNWSSVQLRGAPAFQPHFNHSVGRYVSSSRDFDEALRRGGEDQNTTYQRIDPGDYGSITPHTDTEAIEISARTRRDMGLTPPSSTRIIV